MSTQYERPSQVASNAVNSAGKLISQGSPSEASDPTITMVESVGELGVIPRSR